MPRLVAVPFLAISFGFFLFNLWAVFQNSLPAWIPILGMVMFGYLTYMIYFAGSANGVVWWNESGISGPCRLLPLPFAKNRCFVEWDQLILYREDQTQTIQVLTNDNRKLVWSALYRNSLSLKDRIRQRCPGLEFRTE